MNVLRPRLLLALLLLAPAATPDTILLVGGREITGISIQSETYETVEYKKGRVNQKQDAGDVVSVTYSKTNKEYQEAVAALAEGKNIAAAQLFVTAADDDLPDHIRATALAEAGEALLSNNNFADAQGVFGQLLGEFPKTRHLARALLGQGKAKFFHGDVKGAKAAFDSLKSQAESKGFGDRWANEAEFYSLWAAEQTGADVLDDYRKLQKRVEGSNPALANQCALNMARAHLAKGEGDRAKRLFEDIIESRNDAPRDVVAGAYNGRGDCIYAQAKGYMNAGEDYSDDALEAYREALFDYLRVYVSYKGVTREQPQALLRGGICFKNIAQLDESADDYEYRGLVLHKVLRDDFGWSKQAKDPEAQQ